MKNKTIKALFSVSTAFILILIIGIIAVTKINGTEVLKYSVDEEIIISEYCKNDLHTLLLKADQLDIDKSSDNDITLMYAAIERMLLDTPENLIIDELLDKSIGDEVKINIITLCSSNNIRIDPTAISQLLDDPDSTTQLKNLVLDFLAGTDSSNKSIIESEIYKADEKTIFRAMLSLQSTDPEKAEQLADEFLDDLSGIFSNRHKAALVVKANSLFTNPDKAKIDCFIELCNRIIFEMPSNDEYEKEVSVIYALCEIKAEQTLEYLLNLTTDTAVEFRSYIVAENKEVIDSLFDVSPTKEKTDLIISAYPYYVPNSEFRKKIKTYMSENEEFFKANDIINLKEVIK